MNLKKTLNENSKKTHFLFLLTLIACGVLVLIISTLTAQQISTKSQEQASTSNVVEFGPYKLYVELATNPLNRERGLMYRTQMADNKGMLFIFETPAVQSFWMKNTYIPLDIIFLDEDFRVVKVHKNTLPNQITETYSSFFPAKYALETKAGWAGMSKLNEGDMLTITIATTD